MLYSEGLFYFMLYVDAIFCLSVCQTKSKPQFEFFDLQAKRLMYSGTQSLDSLCQLFLSRGGKTQSEENVFYRNVRFRTEP
jgi:hypothetical protein